MRDDDFELAIKVVIVGNGVVGKSSMIQRFCRGLFTNEYKKTLGVDFMERKIRVKSDNIRLMLWDTAGQEEFDAITKAYYRGANACVIVFSTTDRQSFLSIEKWKKKVEYECGDIPMAIVHNKIDLSHQSVVTREEAESLAKRYHCKLFRTSVKDNINVENVFHFLAESYMESINDDNNSVDEEPVFKSLNNTSYYSTPVLSSPPNNIMPTLRANTSSFGTNSLYHQRSGHHYMTNYRQQPQHQQRQQQNNYKMGYNYFNNTSTVGRGIVGVPSQLSLSSNAILSHYRYKGKYGGGGGIGGLPVRPLPTQRYSNIINNKHHNNNNNNSSSIVLHHRPQSQYEQLLAKHSLHNNYIYGSGGRPYQTTTNTSSNNSFLKTCRIF
ncbi:ras-related protein Rab-23-like [Oppia nitens]|uniref:ras-related protein Rab-23-like n=1 Tax=Oppia nitens TaxID=1686743 RepID=UPI0023D9EBEB|nr:ras-related protein Rab-23-like [Oppia nitens]